MIRRFLFSISLTVALVSLANAQQMTAKLSFKTVANDFGTIKEESGIVTATFDFENIGKSPLLIQRVITTCSCTLSDWPKEPIIPGSKGVIRIQYNPKGRPGVFDQTITVYSNAETSTFILRIMGKVLERPKTIEEIYNRALGDFRFRSNHLSFDRVFVSKVVTDTLDFISIAKEPAKMSADLSGLPHLSVKFVPETVKPNEKCLMLVTFDAKKRNDWGFVIDRFNIIQNGTVVPNGLISISANIEEDFSKLTDDQLANSPKIEFDNVIYNFDPVEEGQPVEHDFVFKNSGKSNLIINKIKPGCGCTTINPSENIIKPGKSSSFKATFKTNGYTGRVSKTITVITNDPKTPSVVLRISGIVNAPAKKN